MRSGPGRSGALGRLGLVASIATAAGCRPQEQPIDARLAPAPEPAAARLLYPNAPSSFVELVDNARRGVVSIRTTTPVKAGPAAMFPGAPDSVPDLALGTGFLIAGEPGVYVITNDHIVAGARDLRVALVDGSEVTAKVLGRDPKLDLALLSLVAPAPSNSPGSAGSADGLEAAHARIARLEGLPIGDSDALRVGEWVVALGNPFGREVTAAAGIISATGDERGSLVGTPTMTYGAYLQTDARIHRGNSGGPVIDTAGRVVGVAVAPGDRPTELSFAIPINRVMEIVGALRDHGQIARGWLGAYVAPLTRELAQSLKLPAPDGVVVVDVKAGSPAAKAALRRGDVLLRWGKQAISDRGLPWLIASTPVGRPTEVAIWRNGSELAVSVTTEKIPE